MPRARTTLATLAATLLTVTAPAAAHAAKARETLLSEPPQISSGQAIALLNAQREANGLPAGLAEDSQLSQGCWNHANLYWDAPGQFPHDELPGQPGYTELGDRAAESSMLGGGRGYWSPTVNPWSRAPLHLYGLLEPNATTAWYGESRRVLGGRQRVCMGTGGAPRPQPEGFTTYSYPGDGATGVTTEYLAGERPFAPGEAVGIPPGTVTGPYILLFPSGSVDHELRSATLSGPDGPVGVRVARPDTPAPPDVPAGWEHWETVGNGYYVIPVEPLVPDTRYTLSAHWDLTEPTRTHVQTVRFTTAGPVTGPACPADICLRGKLALRTKGRRLKLALTPAVGQRVSVEIRRGKRMCAERRRGRCPRRNRWFLGYTSTERTLRARRPRMSVKLPPRQRGLNALWVSVTVDGPFTARGRKWRGAQLTATDFRA